MREVRNMHDDSREKDNTIKRLSLSAVVASLIFIGLTSIQGKLIGHEETIEVYQVINDIQAGTKLTKDNVNQYLEMREIGVSAIPENYIINTDDVIDKFVNRTYKAKDIITLDGVTDTEALYRVNLENPVEVSFKVSGLDNSVTGLLREGDYVNIYGIRKSEEGTTDLSYQYSDNLNEIDSRLTFKHVYIAKAFDSQGNRIKVSNETNADGEPILTSVFNVIIDEEDVDLFTAMLQNCDIKMVKILYDTDGDYKEFLNKANKNAGQIEVYTEDSVVQTNDTTENITEPQGEVVVDVEPNDAIVENGESTENSTNTTNSTESTNAIVENTDGAN